MPEITTDAVGEEDPTTLALGEEAEVTSLALGEEVEYTTLAYPEEDDPPIEADPALVEPFGAF